MHFQMAEELGQIPEFIKTQSTPLQHHIASLPLNAGKFRQIVLIGRGSSAHACRFASYLLCHLTGRPPIEFHPTSASLTGLHTDLSDMLVWAFSASGQSRETIRGASWFKQRGATVLAITEGGPTSTMGSLADHIVPLLCGPEHAVPATKSFIAQLLVAANLSGCELSSDAAELATTLNRMATNEDADILVRFMQNSRINLMLGYGPTTAAAFDGALKLHECASLPAQAWSYEAFMHGPIGFLTNQDRVILLIHPEAKIPSGLLAGLKNRGCPLCLLEPQNYSHPDETDLRHYPNLTRIKVDGPCGFWQSTIPYTFLLHQAAMKLAIQRGLNPDKPQGLHKITLV